MKPTHQITVDVASPSRPFSLRIVAASACDVAISIRRSGAVEPTLEGSGVALWYGPKEPSGDGQTGHTVLASSIGNGIAIVSLGPEDVAATGEMTAQVLSTDGAGASVGVLASGSIWLMPNPSSAFDPMVFDEPPFVRFDKIQDLADAEKAQARANIGAGTGGGEENVIEVVKVNGTALVPDAQKAVNVTKEGLGLGNVDNTSDMNKPVSTAMQAALDGKMNILTGSSTNTIPTIGNGTTGQLKSTNVVARTNNGFDRIELHGTGLPNEIFGMDINGPFLKANDDNQARVAIPTPSNSDTIALESKTIPKVLSPTPGNAVKLDSSGNVVDSGIAMPESPIGVEAALLRDIDVGTAATRDVPSSGNASEIQVVLGSDTRLTNARTPTAHTHEISDVTWLQVALDGKADDSDIVLECRTAYSAWTPIRELTDEEKELFYAEDQSSAQDDYAITVEDTPTGEAGTWKVYVGGYQCGVGNTFDSALTLECVSGTPAFLSVFSYIPSTDPDHHKIATRTQATLPGYVLGRQTGKPLADASDVAAKADSLFTVAPLPSSVTEDASRIYTVAVTTASQSVSVALPSLSSGKSLTVELALVVASGASVGSVSFTVNGTPQTATWLDTPTWTAGKTNGMAVRLMNISGTYTLLANKFGEW